MDRLFSLLGHFSISDAIENNEVNVVISAFHVKRHTYNPPPPPQIEFNTVRFIVYRIPRLCSTFAVQSIEQSGYKRILDVVTARQQRSGVQWRIYPEK